MMTRKDDVLARPARRTFLSLLLLGLSMGALGGCKGGASSGGEEGQPAATRRADALPEAPRVTGAEARALVARGAELLDVTPRPRADRSLIEGRIHIPIQELGRRMGELPRDRDIVVYCLGGRLSPRAGARLRAAGYRAFVMGRKSNWDL